MGYGEDGFKIELGPGDAGRSRGRARLADQIAITDRARTRLQLTLDPSLECEGFRSEEMRTDIYTPSLCFTAGMEASSKATDGEEVTEQHTALCSTVQWTPMWATERIHGSVD